MHKPETAPQDGHPPPTGSLSKDNYCFDFRLQSQYKVWREGLLSGWEAIISPVQARNLFWGKNGRFCAIWLPRITELACGVSAKRGEESRTPARKSKCVSRAKQSSGPGRRGAFWDRQSDHSSLSLADSAQGLLRTLAEWAEL